MAPEDNGRDIGRRLAAGVTIDLRGAVVAPDASLRALADEIGKRLREKNPRRGDDDDPPALVPA